MVACDPSAVDPALVPSAAIAPVVAPGSLAGAAQPVLAAEAGAGTALLLRPWRAADAEAVMEAFRDPAIRHWHRRAGVTTPEARAWIERWSAAWKAETAAHWAVVREDDETALLGRMALRDLWLAEGAAEVAYWTVPQARGVGIAPRALEALTDWAFGIGLRRLELAHSTANPASCRVAGKCGFTYEGTRRSALLHADGMHDMHLHARIAPPERQVAEGFALRPAAVADIQAIAELRAVVLRPDLERLGRYDELRVRRRVWEQFVPGRTRVIEVDGRFAGSVTLRPRRGGGTPADVSETPEPEWELEHFYLAPECQGRGLGGRVLRRLLAEADGCGAGVRLAVLRGSGARRFYERHGFRAVSEEGVDVILERGPGSTRL